MGNIIFENDIVYITVEKKVCIVYINNGKENRISNPEFIKVSELEEILKKYEIQVLIIKGNGKNFSMGADVNKFGEYKDNIDDLKKALNKGKNLLNYIENLKILTIAVITGACFGAGFEIALSCKLRFANERALLAFPESNIGLMPGMGGSVRLTKMLGRAKALELILSGDFISTQEAYELKVVDKIVPKKQELDYTLDWIDTLLSGKSNEQISSIVLAVNNAVKLNEDEAYELETEAFAHLIQASN